LNKELDNTINDYFSDIFEIYDDIKHIGEEQNITLIKNKEFNEDNLMRYHFVSYTNEDYDPTAAYVLNYLKTRLTNLRNEANGSKDYTKIHDFIQTYISDIKEYFLATRRIIERVKTEPKYYKIFSILNLSATLYPLITKLEMIDKLEVNLPSEKNASFTFLDLIEIIDVRIYKTRGTDPKADISGFAYRLNKHYKTEDIENWLLWFNQRWMSKDEFQSNLSSSVFGNRALNLIFIEYCEELKGKKFEIEELNKISSKSPNIEHILSQTPKFSPRALGFKNTEDFIDYEHTLGNLTILEKSFNSSIQNKSAIDKVDTYGKSIFKMTKKLASDIDTNKAFVKKDIIERTELLTKSIVLRWWC
jgi:predicted DNA-binding protein